MNRVFLHGRLGEIPDMRYTPAGKAVLNFSLVTDDGFGENKSSTWHDLVAWDKTAETISTHCVKGQQLVIEGRIQKRSWEGQDGQKRYKVEVVVERMEFGSKPRGAENGAHQAAAVDVDPDEIPF